MPSAVGTPRILLLCAGPTPWDLEDRLVGSRPLPLTPEAMMHIQSLIKQIETPIERVLCATANEAALQVARFAANRFSLRVRNAPGLEEVSLGLWEGLTQGDLNHRFPTVFPHWRENPLGINPPDGETLEEAIERIGAAMNPIARKARKFPTLLALRPMALQIAMGILRGESSARISEHLLAGAPKRPIAIG